MIVGKEALINSISKMTVNGNRLELPSEQLDNYAEVKKCLITAGGKYNRCGFIFSENAQEVKDRLVGGEAINDKKKFQFFSTPETIARTMVEMADIKPHDRWLEPHAGQAAIADIAYPFSDDYVLVELMPENCKVLRRKGYGVEEKCFLSIMPDDIGMFDKIIANPPFTKNQDIDHIMHMYEFLDPGGKLVTLSSPGWTFGEQKKQKQFREWLELVNAEVTEIPAGEFKESGTNIGVMMIEITRPAPF